MAFASGQRVTAAALNRATRGDLVATMSADDTITTTEADLTGLTLNVTTTQANTKLTITASLDWSCTGTTDLTVIKLFVDGTVVTGNMNRHQSSGRVMLSKTWNVTRATASTFVVKLRAVKTISGDTTTIFGTHSTLVVSGNGIS